MVPADLCAITSWKMQSYNYPAKLFPDLWAPESQFIYPYCFKMLVFEITDLQQQKTNIWPHFIINAAIKILSMSKIVKFKFWCPSHKQSSLGSLPIYTINLHFRILSFPKERQVDVNLGFDGNQVQKHSLQSDRSKSYLSP